MPQPHGDLAVCLLALDAKVHLADGREVGVLEAEGLVTAVSFTVPERWFYTQGDAPPAELGLDRHGRVRRRPDRARRRRPHPGPRAAAEEALASGDIERAAELSVEAADPFDDAFASAWYRRRVLPVHVRRALSNAL